MSARAPAVEILTVGDELLLGQTVDTNAAWLSRELSTQGIRVVRRATVGDEAAAIHAAVSEALARTGALICTGGLGPTRDDLTRPVVAEVFGLPLRIDEEVLAALEARFRRLGREMAASNRCQAEVPEGAIVLPNANGTAPGLILRDEADRFAVLLPGVPREMRALYRDALLPWLLERWPARPGAIVHRVLRTTGIAESKLAELLEPAFADLGEIGVAFLPSGTGVDVRLTSWGTQSEADASRAFDALEARIRAAAGAWIYATGDADLAEAVGERLRAAGLSIAVAESCTGGLLAKRLTDRAGSSDYMLGGVVAYANSAKIEQLGVPEREIEQHGAVSEPVALAMARGVAQRLGSACALAVTGIAGPGGGTPAKPVGTVCIAGLAPGSERVLTLRLPGDRAEIRERSAQAALGLLWKLLDEEAP